jgi:hypothetical protein
MEHDSWVNSGGNGVRRDFFVMREARKRRCWDAETRNRFEIRSAKRFAWLDYLVRVVLKSRAWCRNLFGLQQWFRRARSSAG